MLDFSEFGTTQRKALALGMWLGTWGPFPETTHTCTLGRYGKGLPPQWVFLYSMSPMCESSIRLLGPQTNGCLETGVAPKLWRQETGHWGISRNIARAVGEYLALLAASTHPPFTSPCAGVYPVQVCLSFLIYPQRKPLTLLWPMAAETFTP